MHKRESLIVCQLTHFVPDNCESAAAAEKLKFGIASLKFP